MLNLVSDSSCDLISGELNSPYARLTVAPMCLHVGGQDYLDTPELDIPALLSKLAHHRSSSACPSPAAYAEAFEQGEETICVTISSQLSGSYNAAMAARDLVLAEHPEKKIFVLDSRATSGAMILLLRKAAELAERGLPFEELCTELQSCQKNIRLCFTLEHFDNLVNNGRMPPLAGTLLQTLGIRIVAEATAEGTIRVAKKARGEAHTAKAITQLMADAKNCADSHVIITHCQNPEGAERLRNAILDRLPVKAVEVLPCRGLTSFYAMDKGPDPLLLIDFPLTFPAVLRTIDPRGKQTVARKGRKALP